MAVKKLDKQTDKPSIYGYHDYRVYLKDLLTHGRANKLSMRKIAKDSGLTAAYISMVVNNQRNLSSKNIDKLSPALGLSDSENSFLKLLCTLADSESLEMRTIAYNKIKNFGNYKKGNLKEVEVYKYLSEWYYVVIRELSELPDFKLDAFWIQSRLRKKVSINDIKKAIKFLTDNDYIKVNAKGEVQQPEKRLECMSGVFNLSLGKFHKQMFDIVGDAFAEVPRENRNILGHTVAIPKDKVTLVKNLLEETFKEIVKICDDQGKDKDESKVVYHVGLAAVPLTNESKDVNDGNR